jgi:transposase-like protein
MQCPECGSTDVSQNGRQRGKQNYLCKICRRQFIEVDDPSSGYSDEFKRECLKMYVNGMGFRGIERVKGVHPTTVITWVKQIAELLPDADDPDVSPEVGELDELETFVGSKKTKFGCGQPLTTSEKGF